VAPPAVESQPQEQVRATAARLLYELSRMESPPGVEGRTFEKAVEDVKGAVERLLTRVPG